MIRDWLLMDNLQPFLTVLGWLVDYDFGPDDWTAIHFGVRETDAEGERWYDYEFAGRRRAVFSLAIDPGTSVVHARIEVPPELEPQVQLAISIFAHFTVRA